MTELRLVSVNPTPETDRCPGCKRELRPENRTWENGWRCSFCGSKVSAPEAP